MKSIWTTSESQGILPSAQKTCDLQELIGDPNHDQQKLQPTPEHRVKGGAGLTDKYTTRAAKAEKPTQTLQGQKAFKSKQQTPPQKLNPTLARHPCQCQEKKPKKIRLLQRIQAEVETVKTVQGALCQVQPKDQVSLVFCIPEV